jgi:hypothetical protein
MPFAVAFLIGIIIGVFIGVSIGKSQVATLIDSLDHNEIVSIKGRKVWKVPPEIAKDKIKK